VGKKLAKKANEIKNVDERRRLNPYSPVPLYTEFNILKNMFNSPNNSIKMTELLNVEYFSPKIKVTNNFRINP
jgi:hypothetical protein